MYPIVADRVDVARYDHAGEVCGAVKRAIINRCDGGWDRVGALLSGRIFAKKCPIFAEKNAI